MLALYIQWKQEVKMFIVKKTKTAESGATVKRDDG